MEIKREIVESKSEVSKDNLWLKPEDNKKKLLYYGIKGWTELIGSGSGTCEPGDTPDCSIDKLDLSKLTTDELLKLNKELEKIKKKLPPEEYIRILISSYGNLYDIARNNSNISKYIENNLSGKWSYEYDGQKYDIPEVVKVLDKGERLQINPANPDLYIEAINDKGINYMLLITIMQLRDSQNLAYYLGYKGYIGTYYELQNGEVKTLENAALSDYIRIVDKSVENGSKEVTDGFRPRTKRDTLIISYDLDIILEYYRYRSYNNIIQDYDKYIIVYEQDKDYNYVWNKYQVVSGAGFTLLDYYIIYGNNSENDEGAKIHKENILKFIGEVDIKNLRNYYKEEYLQEGGTKKTWNIKKGDKFYLNSQFHIEFTALADDIKKEDLEKIEELDAYLLYSNHITSSEYTYVEKYYSPYEDYKNPQDTELFRTYKDNIKQMQEFKKRAEESKIELVSLLERLKDKIQYNGEIITTIATI